MATTVFLQNKGLKVVLSQILISQNKTPQCDSVLSVTTISMVEVKKKALVRLVTKVCLKAHKRGQTWATSRVISLTFFCHSGVKYSFTRDANM